MTPTILRQIGTDLYGPRWQTSIAHALSINPRTMRRMATGAASIPEGVQRDIALLVHTKRVEE